MSRAPMKPDARPLYEQVRLALLQRIQSGAWPPGAALPNEFELAAEMGVSQGTARKAINALADERLVVRRQGRGTFVAEHTPAEVLFRFFQFYDAAGNRVSPESTNLNTRRAKARRDERARLKLAPSARVIRHARVRTVDGRPFVSELIVLPEDQFSDLGTDGEIPNTLYDLFQRRFGVTVARADEQITVDAADARIASELAIAKGTPLMVIDRVTFSIDGRPIEWRLSRCHLADLHYLVRLS